MNQDSMTLDDFKRMYKELSGRDLPIDLAEDEVRFLNAKLNEAAESRADELMILEEMSEEERNGLDLEGIWGATESFVASGRHVYPHIPLDQFKIENQMNGSTPYHLDMSSMEINPDGKPLMLRFETNSEGQVVITSITPPRTNEETP